MACYVRGEEGVGACQARNPRRGMLHSRRIEGERWINFILISPIFKVRNQISEFPRGLREEAAAAGRGGGVGGEDDSAHGGRREGHSVEIQVT